jgi:hypothetical protein
MSETKPDAAQAPAQPAGTPAAAPAAAPAAPAAGKETATPPATPAAASAEQKPAAEAKPKEEGKKEEPKGPPEKYELTLAEKSPIPAARIEEIAAEAKAKGLSNEAAQELLAREEGAVLADRAREVAALEARKAEWINEVKNDPEMGGENANKTAELANRVIEKHASPKLKEIFNSTGMGNFPEFVRFCASVGKQFGEGEILPSGGGAAQELSHKEALFGGSVKK